MRLPQLEHRVPVRSTRMPIPMEDADFLSVGLALDGGRFVWACFMPAGSTGIGVLNAYQNTL